jgi:hypothetical protein
VPKDDGVRDLALEAAGLPEADEEFDIWGGLNRTERVRLREGMRARRPAERRPGRRVTGWSRSGGLLSGAGMAAWLAGVPF